jgi:UDP-glucose 4-epimerase
MKHFVIGGAGFIGSNLVERLLPRGQVVVWDNFSSGFEEFLTAVQNSAGFQLVRGDLLDFDGLAKAMAGSEIVFHLAANADVRFGLNCPKKDLQQNTMATFNVLEAMRVNNIKKIVFASSGSIYGEPAVFPTPESAAFPMQTSLYGASKLAAEGLIQAYCEGFDFQAWIFRFVSVLGERYHHGHVIDFYKKLLENPRELQILGDGHQKKSYIYIEDCLEALLLAVEVAREKINIFNLGSDEYCEVNDSVRWICEYLGIKPCLKYTGGLRGWVGDSPFIYLDISRIKKLGWQPKTKIRQAVIKTLEYLRDNQWLLKKNH